MPRKGRLQLAVSHGSIPAMRPLRTPVIAYVLVSLLVTGTLAHLFPILQLHHLVEHTGVADGAQAIGLRAIVHHESSSHVHDDPDDELASQLFAQHALVELAFALIFAVSMVSLLVLLGRRLSEVVIGKVSSRPLKPPSHPPKLLPR
jgi:hypothetical protein